MMNNLKSPKFESLIVASHNQGKIREISDLLEPYKVTVSSASEMNLPEPEETGDTFHENALIKAKSAMEVSGQVALADDSGIEVAGLNGQPGIYSARWAGPNKDFSLAMQRVWDELQTQKPSIEWPPVANFTCVLCLAFPDATHRFYEGKIYGHLTWPPSGENGFGYDPFFVAKGYDQTFGEMLPQDKHKISHRARAFEQFVADCFES